MSDSGLCKANTELIKGPKEWERQSMPLEPDEIETRSASQNT